MTLDEIAASMTGRAIVRADLDERSVELELDDGRSIEFVSWWNDEGGMEINADPVQLGFTEADALLVGRPDREKSRRTSVTSDTEGQAPEQVAYAALNEMALADYEEQRLAAEVVVAALRDARLISIERNCAAWQDDPWSAPDPVTGVSEYTGPAPPSATVLDAHSHVGPRIVPSVESDGVVLLRVVCVCGWRSEPARGSDGLFGLFLAEAARLYADHLEEAVRG